MSRPNPNLILPVGTRVVARKQVQRDGELEWDAVNEWRLQLHREFDEAAQITTLPERPDYEQANEFLIKARRHAAGLQTD